MLMVEISKGLEMVVGCDLIVKLRRDWPQCEICPIGIHLAPPSRGAQSLPSDQDNNADFGMRRAMEEEPWNHERVEGGG